MITFTTKTTLQRTVDLKDIKIPSTADDWQLYDIPGVGKAARGMTGALKRALRAKTKEKACQIMREAMNKWADWGAADSEPRNVAEHYLQKYRGEEFCYDI